MANSVEKRWKCPIEIPEEASQNLPAYPPIFRQILFNRGIENTEAAEKFLRAEEPLFDPHELQGMRSAVNLIGDAINNHNRIVIFGDYDVDGVTSTTLLVQLLKNFQADVEMYIPNRLDEGYGFSFDALQEVLILQPDLIITVDCGVRSIEEVASAKDQGVKVIITDHHQPFDTLPPADAIICPRQEGDPYPNKDLAGVGIAYKLAQSILEAYPAPGICVESWLDLVALGTISDLAPVIGENRVMVRKGIELIRQGLRPGILALANVSGINIRELISYHIGFMLGPRLNAAGRLSSARKAFDLLMAEDNLEAGPLALQLDQENQERQRITRHIQKNVEERYDFSSDHWLILFSDEEFNEGVIGLAASRLAESFYRPSVIGVEKEDIIRASCRSIPEVNITSALDECMDLLVRHGGHAMAAGLTIKKENILALKERLSTIIQREMAGADLSPVFEAEMEVHLGDLHPSILKLLERLEPTGVGNSRPLFISRNVEIRQIRTVGKTKDHLKLIVSQPKEYSDKNGRAQVMYDAIAFQFGYLAEVCHSGDSIDILYSYETNTYNGRESLQLNIRDMKLNHSKHY